MREPYGSYTTYTTYTTYRTYTAYRASFRDTPLLRLHVPDADIAIGHRAVVALEHEGAFGLLIAVGRGAGGAGDLDVLVDDLAVVDDLDEDGVGDLLAVLVEARGFEDDVEALPLAGRLGCVDAGRMALLDALTRGGWPSKPGGLRLLSQRW